MTVYNVYLNKNVLQLDGSVNVDDLEAPIKIEALSLKHLFRICTDDDSNPLHRCLSVGDVVATDKVCVVCSGYSWKNISFDEPLPGDINENKIEVKEKDFGYGDDTTMQYYLGYDGSRVFHSTTAPVYAALLTENKFDTLVELIVYLEYKKEDGNIPIFLRNAIEVFLSHTDIKEEKWRSVHLIFDS